MCFFLFYEAIPYRFLGAETSNCSLDNNDNMKEINQVLLCSSSEGMNQDRFHEIKGHPVSGKGLGVWVSRTPTYRMDKQHEPTV